MDGLISSIATVFYVVPFSLRYGLSVTLIAITFAALIQIIQRQCYINFSTSLGTWFHVLSYIGSISYTARSLAITLYYIDESQKMTTWLRSLSNYFGITSIIIITILTIIVLCSFGLEGSPLFRTILTFSVFACLTVWAINTPYEEWSNVSISKPIDVPQVLQCTLKTLSGFVLLIIHNINSNYYNYRNIDTIGNRFENYDRYSNNDNSFRKKDGNLFYIVLKIIILGIFMAYLSLTLLLYWSQTPKHFQTIGENYELANDTDKSIHLFNAVTNKWNGFTVTILLVLNFGLILPEIMSNCSNYFTKLGGKIFPICIKKEITFTGTNAICIIICGFLSIPIATLMSLGQLTELISAGSLCGTSIDCIYNIYKNYQPTYRCKDIGNSGDEAKYEMLTSIPDEDFDGDQNSRLSDDSGHSSDTDIDAVVAEFKERIKVVTTMAEPIISEPTVYTGRRVTICLTISILLIFFTGIAINYSLLIITVLLILVTLGMVSIIVCQPSRQSSQQTSVWFSTIYMIFASSLTCNFSTSIIFVIVLWTLFCAFGWILFNPASNNFIKRLKHIVRPKRRLRHFKRHSSSLTLVDTIHIIR